MLQIAMSRAYYITLSQHVGQDAVESVYRQARQSRSAITQQQRLYNKAALNCDNQLQQLTMR